MKHKINAIAITLEEMEAEFKELQDIVKSLEDEAQEREDELSACRDEIERLDFSKTDIGDYFIHVYSDRFEFYGNLIQMNEINEFIKTKYNEI